MTRIPTTPLIPALVFELLLCALISPWGASPVLAQNRYLGAASCASSNCHGNSTPRAGTNVLQNEYGTWYKNEAHSQAWKVLTTKDSKIIGKHLGIAAPENEPLCLRCHATYVPKNLQGPKFRLSDGVSCESCHGAAEGWIQSHTAREATHAQNISRGLTDLVSHNERSRVCLECHLGTENQAVNHRLIGAGHPRLTFELDTYGILQPNHWEIDKDYVARKQAYNSARAWLVGQVARGLEQLKALSSPTLSKFGALPELTLFYCYNCHHSLKEDQWKSRSYGGHPGELQLNLSSLLMVREAMKVLDPGLSQEIAANLEALTSSYRQGQQQAALSKLREIFSSRAPSTASSFAPDNSKNLLRALVSFSANNSFLPYEVAEQCAMGISALAATLDGGGKAYKAPIDAIYAALKDEEGFNAEAFRKAAAGMLGGV